MTAPHSTHDHQLIHAIERIRKGDSVGFEMIYHLFIDDVRRWCRCQLGWRGRCNQFEDDLAQEVMLELWQTMSSFRDPCGPNGEKSCDFVFLAIHRLVFEHAVDRGRYNKRQKRLRKSSLHDLYAELIRNHCMGNDLGEIDARDALQIALERASRSKSQEIIIRKLRGESNQQIALALQLSSRSIRRLLADLESLIEAIFNT